MEKGFWGPATWCTLHTAAVGYRPENRLSFKQFVYSLPYLLPCEYCREHLTQNLKTIPLTDVSLQNNQNLFMWTYFLHDLVNKQLKKKASPAPLIAANYYFHNINNNQFWGNCFWRTIHAFAAAYRPEPAVKTAFKQFVYSLIGILPDEESRRNYRNLLSQLPLTEKYFESAQNLFLWTYFLHDLVNRKILGKESPPFETIKAQYFNEHVCNSCGITPGE